MAQGRGKLISMTWTFVYLVSLLLGLTLAVASHAFSRFNGDHRVVLPGAEQASGRTKLLAVRFALVLAFFGLVGMPLSAWQRLSPAGTVLVSLAAAVLLSLLAMPRKRRHESDSRIGSGSVVRTIPPGGFGQVAVTQQGTRIVLAARSADDREITAGSEVEIIDATRSVLTVRRSESTYD
jgi:hypothetical protein